MNSDDLSQRMRTLEKHLERLEQQQAEVHKDLRSYSGEIRGLRAVIEAEAKERRRIIEIGELALDALEQAKTLTRSPIDEIPF